MGRVGCYYNMSHIIANIQTGMNVKDKAGGLFQSPLNKLEGSRGYWIRTRES